MGTPAGPGGPVPPMGPSTNQGPENGQMPNQQMPGPSNMPNHNREYAFRQDGMLFRRMALWKNCLVCKMYMSKAYFKIEFYKE